MEPPAASARIVGRQVRSLGLLPVAAGRARSGRQAARHAGRERHGARHAARRRIRAQVEARLRRSRRRVLSKAMDGKPVKVVWTREDDLHNDYFHTVSVEHLEAGVDAKGKPVAWLHRTVAPTIVSTFDAGAEAGGALGARHGRHQRAVRHSEHPHREPGGDRAHAHRLVPLGVEHSACVRGAVVRRRARRGSGTRPEGLPARGDRARARGRSPQMLGDTWNHGESPERYPVDTGRLRRVTELAAKEAGWGRSLPKGSGLGHRRALQLRQLRRGGRARSRSTPRAS